MWNWFLFAFLSIPVLYKLQDIKEHGKWATWWNCKILQWLCPGWKSQNFMSFLHFRFSWLVFLRLMINTLSGWHFIRHNNKGYITHNSVLTVTVLLLLNCFSLYRLFWLLRFSIFKENTTKQISTFIFLSYSIICIPEVLQFTIWLLEGLYIYCFLNFKNNRLL